MSARQASYYRARQAGRFINEDPAGFVSGNNFYAYVWNNPTDLVDPLGLQGGPWHPPSGIHTKCTDADDCTAIKGKMWVLQRMIASHTGWDRAMPRPRGGNRHAQDIADLWKPRRAVTTHDSTLISRWPAWRGVVFAFCGVPSYSELGKASKRAHRKLSHRRGAVGSVESNLSPKPSN